MAINPFIGSQNTVLVSAQRLQNRKLNDKQQIKTSRFIGCYFLWCLFRWVFML